MHQPSYGELISRLESFASSDSRFLSAAPKTIQVAKTFLRFLNCRRPLPLTVVNQTTAGGVGFSFRQGDRNAYLHFRNNGSADAIFTGDAEPKLVPIDQSAGGLVGIILMLEEHLSPTLPEQEEPVPCPPRWFAILTDPRPCFAVAAASVLFLVWWAISGHHEHPQLILLATAACVTGGVGAYLPLFASYSSRTRELRRQLRKLSGG